MMSSVRILFLGPENSPLIDWLESCGEHVTQRSERLSADWVAKQRFDFLISYGYRYVLGKAILGQFPDRAINLHISYLPWNRGADPNLWSFVDETPKGVTIHHMDEGIDTGDIIVQEQVEFDIHRETLASSYDKLHAVIRDLFMQHWEAIKAGRCPRLVQSEGGSFHKKRDREKLADVLSEGWQTPVSVLTDNLEDRNS